jgi:hypothetical protein
VKLLTHGFIFSYDNYSAKIECTVSMGSVIIELHQVRIKGIFTTDGYMYTTTKRTSEIFAIVVIAATALTLLTSATTQVTPSVLAAKTGLPHHTSTGGGSHIAKSLSTDTASSANNGNKDKMNSLFACESSSAHGSGQLTETGVLDCYLQAFSQGHVNYLSVLPNNHNSNNNNNTNSVIGGTDSGSGSGTSSSPGSHATSHTLHPHHHSSTGTHTSKGSTTGPTVG